MALNEFIDNLRLASRMLPTPTVSSEQGPQADAHYRSVLHSADLWLSTKTVSGFNPDDFADWPKQEREKLEEEVSAFRTIAEQVPADKPATKAQSKQARKYLENVIDLVRRPILAQWLGAQEQMMEEASEAAKAKGWHTEKDQTTINESLLGTYKAPRLRIRSIDQDVYLKPVAYFGSGRQGVVDLVVLPTYETAYLVVFKNGEWQIVSLRGSMNKRPFTRDAFVNTVARLPK